jgi:hypothetical protein
MKNKLILALICLLVSCQSYRAERKINKLKEWGYLKDSTITVYDTIRGFSHDTFIKFDTMNRVDTITTLKNGIKVVTYIKWKEREVTQLLTQKDTIFTHKYTTKVIKQPVKWWNRFKVGVWFCSILLLLYLLSINYIQKQLNK